MSRRHPPTSPARDRSERVVSEDDLLAAVWGGRIVSESTLASRINAVRKAVGDSGAAQNLIRTVPRRGIRFVGEVREEPQHQAAHPSQPADQRSRRPTLALADKPSIAVLPFANLTGDPAQDYLDIGKDSNGILIHRHHTADRRGLSLNRVCTKPC